MKWGKRIARLTNSISKKIIPTLSNKKNNHIPAVVLTHKHLLL